MDDPRELDLRSKLDALAEEYADILGPPDAPMPICLAVSLLSAWSDPTDTDSQTWVSRRDSATTSTMAAVGLIAYATARAVE